MKKAVWLSLFALLPGLCFAEEGALNLTDKTYLFDYGDSAYEISIESKSTLRWKLVKGEYPGPQEDSETYFASRITDGIIFISWVEASGLGLYNVLDLNASALTTHAREGDTTHINTGTVTEHR